MKVCWPYTCKVWWETWGCNGNHVGEEKLYRLTLGVHSEYCSCFTLPPTHENGVAVVLKLYGFESKSVLNFKLLKF